MCHSVHVWMLKFWHKAWWIYWAIPLWRSRYSFLARVSHPESIWAVERERERERFQREGVSGKVLEGAEKTEEEDVE